MKTLREGAAGGITKFFLFGFLILAVGGMVFMDVGGVFRGGVGSTDVAKVGDEKIKIGYFDRTLRRVLSQVGMSPQEAYRLGYVNQVLAGEIRASLLRQAAHSKGVLVSDKRVADQIQELVAPLVREGQSPKDVFSQVLRAQGMGEGEFVQAIKRDIGNNLLIDMLNGNFSAVSDDMAQDLYKYQNETRDIKYLEFLDKDVASVKEPSEVELLNLYEATKESYATPERRTFKILTLDTDNLKKTLAISEEDIRGAYEDHIDSYNVPASWTLDQAIVPTQEQAQKIYKAAAEGAPIKEAVEDITNATAAYAGSQVVKEGDMLEALKAPVMKAKEAGALLEPVNSPLGWHVVRVEKITKARTQGFDEVKAQIREDLMESQLIDQQYALAGELDDALAGGASLEEVKEHIDLKVQDLPPLDQFGLNAEGGNGLNDYADIRDTILETGFGIAEGETSAVFENSGGKFMAVHVVKVEPKNYTPFSEVKTALAKRWINDQRRLENKAIVRAELDKGAALEELARAHTKPLKTKSDITRIDEEAKPFAVYALPNIFEAELNKPIMVDIEGGTAIVEVTGYNWPDISTQDPDYKTFKSSLISSAKSEALRSYLETQEKKRRAMVNERLIKQVYGPSSTQTY